MAGGMKKDGRSPSFSCADRSFHCCKITAEILSGFRIIHAGGQAVFDEAETRMFKPIRIIDLNRQDYAIFGDFSGNGVISRKFHKLLVRHVRGQLHFRVLFFQIVFVKNTAFGGFEGLALQARLICVPFQNGFGIVVERLAVGFHLHVRI